MRLWNHPPHDLDCCLDRAALLTQEGSSTSFYAPQRPAMPQTGATPGFQKYRENYSGQQWSTTAHTSKLPILTDELFVDDGKILAEFLPVEGLEHARLIGLQQAGDVVGLIWLQSKPNVDDPAMTISFRL